MHKAPRRAVHKTISKVTDDIKRRQSFNTAIAAIMELSNQLGKVEYKTAQDTALMYEALDAIVVMLYPFTPHLCHKLWKVLGHADDIETARWPEFDASALVEDENSSRTN